MGRLLTNWQGLDYLVQGEVLQNDAQSIASFLKTSEGLDRTKIGEYLGGR